MNYNFRLIKSALIISIILIVILITQFFFGITYVPTSSMEPYIETDSLVLTQKRMFDIKEKDIYIYKNTEKINIIHRLVDTTKENGITKYVFQGDNNAMPDKKTVSESQIKEKYLAHSHILGLVYKYLKPVILALFVVVGIKTLKSENKKFEEDLNTDY